MKVKIQDRCVLEKSKAEYSNEADLVNDALGDVERNVEQMRNDAVEKRSRISRKQVESIALQLCNVAGRVNEMKEKLPPLERILQKVYLFSKGIKCFSYQIKLKRHLLKLDFIPLRFRKAGTVWCGGARETH